MGSRGSLGFLGFFSLAGLLGSCGALMIASFSFGLRGFLTASGLSNLIFWLVWGLFRIVDCEDEPKEWGV